MWRSICGHINLWDIWRVLLSLWYIQKKVRNPIKFPNKNKETSCMLNSMKELKFHYSREFVEYYIVMYIYWWIYNICPRDDSVSLEDGYSHGWLGIDILSIPYELSLLYRVCLVRLTFPVWFTWRADVMTEVVAAANYSGIPNKILK